MAQNLNQISRLKIRSFRSFRSSFQCRSLIYSAAAAIGFLDQHLLQICDSQLALASENIDEIYLPNSEQALEGNIIHGLHGNSLMFKLSFNVRWDRVFMESRVYKAVSARFR